MDIKLKFVEIGITSDWLNNQLELPTSYFLMVDHFKANKTMELMNENCFHCINCT